jgi:hypothetical protein
MNGEPLKLTPISGQAPGLDVQSSPDIETLDVHELQDGPVIVYDRAQKSHYVLYVPAQPGSSMFESTSSNSRYLVFSVDDRAEDERESPGGPHVFDELIFDRKTQVPTHQKVSFHLGGNGRPAVPAHPVQ